MIIDSSTVGMESVRKYSSVRRDAYVSSNEALGGLNSFRGSMSRFYERFGKTEGMEKLTHSGESSEEENSLRKIRERCLNYLIRLLFGGDYCEDKYTLSEINGKNEDFSGGYILQTTSEEHYFSEQEQTEFHAKGTVATADGREIDFNLGFSMSRRFEERFQVDTVSLKQILCDPLVINLDTDVASVSDQKMMFDLDADGVPDSISRLQAGSGFLALDLNGDGVVNDGRELFGTRSGDGFSDLAKYDSDGNGWIDEADDVFDRLRICVFDEDGHQRLFKLKEKDLGAIFLGNVQSDFSLNDQSTNRLNARLRRTGIFLYENGTAGTIQHLDLAKEMLA